MLMYVVPYFIKVLSSVSPSRDYLKPVPAEPSYLTAGNLAVASNIRHVTYTVLHPNACQKTIQNHPLVLHRPSFMQQKQTFCN